MTDNCTVQLFCEGTWHDVTSVSLFGQEREGWRAKTYSGYAIESGRVYSPPLGAFPFAAKRSEPYGISVPDTPQLAAGIFIAPGHPGPGPTAGRAGMKALDG